MSSCLFTPCSDGFRLTGGMRLRALRRPHPSQKDNLDRFYDELTYLHTQFLAGLKYGPPDVTLELRILKAENHSLTVALLWHGVVGDEALASERSRQWSEFYTVWVRSLGDLYSWDPLEGKALTEVVTPFDPGDYVEILRRDGEISLDKRASHSEPIGFMAPQSSVKTVEASVWYANPYTSHWDTREVLATTLLSQSSPLCVSIVLAAQPLSTAEAEFLQQRLDFCERFAQIQGTNELLDLKVPAVKSEQAKNLLISVARERAQLQENAFLLRVELLAPERVPASVISAVATALTGPLGLPNPPLGHPDPETLAGGCRIWRPSSKADQTAAVRRWREGGFTVLAPCQAPQSLESLVYRFDANEAASALRLPYPGLNLFPGLENSFYRDLPAPSFRPQSGTRLGLPSSGDPSPVLLEESDRMRHLYVLGQTGTGKSTLLKNMVLRDLESGQGLALIDPHGDLAKEILARVPKHRQSDVIYFNPLDPTHAFGLNLLDAPSEWEKDFAVNYFLEVNNILYDDKLTSGPVTETYIRNSLMLTLYQPEDRVPCLLDLFNVLQNSGTRRDYLETCTNPMVKDFWEKSALRAAGDLSFDNVVPYILGRFGRLLYNTSLADIFSQRKTTLDFQKILDEGRVLIVDLSKGLLGNINGYFLALMLLGDLMRVLYRRGPGPQARRPFFLYVDEFQNVATPTFLSLFSEARKFGLGITVANQFFTQLQSADSRYNQMREAILGNIGSHIQFRLGADDAHEFAKVYGNLVDPADFQGLPNYRAYVRLLAKGQLLPPFTMVTDPPWGTMDAETTRFIVEHTHQTWTVPRVNLEHRRGLPNLTKEPDLEDELKRLFGND